MNVVNYGVMARNIFVLLAISLAVGACTDKNRVKISGEIKDASKEKVYLEQVNVDKIVRVDSTQTDKSGNFSFKVRVETPTFYNVRVGNKEVVTVIAQPEEDIKVTGSLAGLGNNYWVDGSENSLWVKLLNFQLNNTRVVLDSLRKAYAALPAGATFAAERGKVAAAWDSVWMKQVNFSKEFILKHAVSPASYYALYQKLDDNNFVLSPDRDLHSYKVVASSLKAMYPESQYTQAILTHLAQISKEMNSERIRQLIANSESSLPEIRLPNVKGDTVALSAQKAKLVVLDFTVLTARDADAYIRDMKAVYDKFRNRGVEIYQVCLDGNKLAWENLVKRYDIRWTCVWDPDGLQSKVARLWNIQSVPADYIINRKSEIVGKNLFGRRLEDRLNDLLK